MGLMVAATMVTAGAARAAEAGVGAPAPSLSTPDASCATAWLPSHWSPDAKFRYHLTEGKWARGLGANANGQQAYYDEHGRLRPL